MHLWNELTRSPLSSSSENSISEDNQATESHYQQLRKRAIRDQEKITKAAIDLGIQRTKLQVR